MGNPDIFKHSKGSFSRLTFTNYAAWKLNMRRILRAIMAWDIVEGRESIPPLALAGANQEEQTAAELKRANYIQRREDAAAAIFNACSDSVRIFLGDSDDPEDMWLTLNKMCNTANKQAGQLNLRNEFRAARPVPGAPIMEYFTKLLEIRNQVAGTRYAISNYDFKVHILDTLPAEFSTIRLFLCVDIDDDASTLYEMMVNLRDYEQDMALQAISDQETNFYNSHNNHDSTNRPGRGGGMSSSSKRSKRKHRDPFEDIAL